MTRRPESIKEAIDTTLSGASHDPTLFGSVVNASKGDSPPMKRKLTLSMAFVLILVLMTGSVAFAATYRGVSWFLTEYLYRTTELDADYLFSNMEQHHDSKYLDATIIDAYWDGLELSIAYRVTPADSSQILQMNSDYEEANKGATPNEADLLLYEPEFINVTNCNDPDLLSRPYNLSCTWQYETDGAITVFVNFPHYDMSNAGSISIPIFNKVTSTQEISLSMLHFYQPTLTDPITAHEHDWLPASCVSPKVCAICERTEGNLGHHDFQPTSDDTRLTCIVCTQSIAKPFNIPATVTLRPGEYSNFVMALQIRLNELGFYNGPFSGMYDDATTEAVKAYQESVNLPIDGICDPETTQRIMQ